MNNEKEDMLELCMLNEENPTQPLCLLLNLYKKMPAKKIVRERHDIDASTMVLGRLASKVAILLQGKHKPSFQRHLDMGDFVGVENISKVMITGKKMEDKFYYRHSGYIGKLKKESLKSLLKRNPKAVLIEAVMGMLPKNRLRAKMIKRLTIK